MLDINILLEKEKELQIPTEIQGLRKNYVNEKGTTKKEQIIFTGKMQQQVKISIDFPDVILGKNVASQ